MLAEECKDDNGSLQLICHDEPNDFISHLPGIAHGGFFGSDSPSQFNDFPGIAHGDFLDNAHGGFFGSDSPSQFNDFLDNARGGFVASNSPSQFNDFPVNDISLEYSN